MMRKAGWTVGLAVLGLSLVAPVWSHCGHCGMGDDKGKAEAHGKSADKHLEKLTKELSLTADQQAQVKAIMEEKQAKMEQVRQETHEKVKAVLTDEQKTKFDALKAKGASCSCPMCAGKADCGQCAECSGKKHDKKKK